MPKNHYNINLNNNCIEPVQGYLPAFMVILGKDLFNTLQENYSDLLKSIIHIEIYDYSDSESSELKSRIFLIDRTYKLYEIDRENSLILDLSMQFSEMPRIAKVNQVLYFLLSTGMYFVIEDNYPILATGVSPCEIFTHLEDKVIFLNNTSSFDIYYSMFSDLYNISIDKSYPQARPAKPEYGSVLKIVTLNKKVFVFQEYAITTLKYISADFDNEDNFIINSKIYKDTICVSDNNIIFCTDAGLFTFDGNNIQKVFPMDTIQMVCSKSDKAVICNKIYYLKTKYDIYGLLRNVILAFDFDNDSVLVYKIDNLHDIYLTQSISHYHLNLTLKDGDNYNNVVLTNKAICQGEKYIEFNKITFGTANMKTIDKIMIFNQGKATLEISSDIETKTFKLNHDFFIENIAINGHIFTFKIYSDYTFRLENIMLECLILEDTYDW